MHIQTHPFADCMMSERRVVLFVFQHPCTLKLAPRHTRPRSSFLPEVTSKFRRWLMHFSIFIALAVAASAAPVFAAPLELDGLLSREEDILARGAPWADHLPSEISPTINRVNADNREDNVLQAHEGKPIGLSTRGYNTHLFPNAVNGAGVMRPIARDYPDKRESDVLPAREVKPDWGYNIYTRGINSEPSPPSADWLGPPYTW